MSQIREERAISLSSKSSFVVVSILFCVNSSHFNPYTIDHFPFWQVIGNEKQMPSGMLYEPSDITPIDTIYPGRVPISQSRTWSHAALAADAAEDLSLI